MSSKNTTVAVLGNNKGAPKAAKAENAAPKMANVELTASPDGTRLLAEIGLDKVYKTEDSGNLSLACVTYQRIQVGDRVLNVNIYVQENVAETAKLRMQAHTVPSGSLVAERQIADLESKLDAMLAAAAKRDDQLDALLRFAQAERERAERLEAQLAAKASPTPNTATVTVLETEPA